MRPTNWNYGPPIPLAPITVHEPLERIAKSGLLDANGNEIEWVMEDPVVGFQPPAERGPYDPGSTWANSTSGPIGSLTVTEVAVVDGEDEDGMPVFDGPDEDTDEVGTIPMFPWLDEREED